MKRGETPLFFLYLMELQEKIEKLVKEAMEENENLFLVDVKISPGGKKIIVLIDSDAGVSISDCSMVSRHIEALLDLDDAVDKAYNLEVSSCGADRPFKFTRQYRKNTGRTVQAKLNDGKIVKGVLISAGENDFEIEEVGRKKENTRHTIPYGEVKEARVVIEFNH